MYVANELFLSELVVSDDTVKISAGGRATSLQPCYILMSVEKTPLYNMSHKLEDLSLVVPSEKL